MMAKIKAGIKKHENLILAGIFILGLMLLISALYDFTYWGKDDTHMKDILAGNYTGVPESHPIYFRWPLAIIISSLYRLLPTVPWYGLFLIFCHFGSLFIIAARSLSFCRFFRTKLLLLIIFFALVFGLLLEHLVFLTFTLAAAMVATVTVFLLVTDKKEKKALPTVILAFITFNIRMDIGILMLVFLGLGVTYLWLSEKPVFTTKNAIKYLTLSGLLLAPIILGLLAHMLAYGTSEWKTYGEINKGLTTITDFVGMEGHEGNEQFYEGIGLTDTEVAMAGSLNWALLDKMDADTMEQIATYRLYQLSAGESSTGHLLFAVKQLYWRMTSLTIDRETPYRALVFLGYGALLGLCFLDLLAKTKNTGRTRRILPTLLLLAAARTALWLYILYQGRSPDRVTHSLYLVELALLFAILLNEIRILHLSKAPDGVKKAYPLIVCTLVGIMAIAITPGKIKWVDNEYKHYEQISHSWSVALDYFGSHPQNRYITLQTSISPSEKIFEIPPKHPPNYISASMWTYGSPLYHDRVAKMFASPDISVARALTDPAVENVFIVSRRGEDIGFITDYYNAQGYGATLEAVDAVGQGLVNELTVYLLRLE